MKIDASQSLFNVRCQATLACYVLVGNSKLLIRHDRRCTPPVRQLVSRGCDAGRALLARGKVDQPAVKRHIFCPLSLAEVFATACECRVLFHGRKRIAGFVTYTSTVTAVSTSSGRTRVPKHYRQCDTTTTKVVLPEMIPARQQLIAQPQGLV